MLENLAIKENMENGEESVGKILEDGLTGAQAVLKEKEWLAFYNRTGWDTLNIKVAGSTGFPEHGVYWTLETCKADALKYETKKKWQKTPKSGYYAALKNGWIKQCCAHMIDGYLAQIKWPLETCKAQALKYNIRNDWIEAPNSGYDAARKKGWLEECCAHMIDGNLAKIKWTLETCKAQALKYETRNDWFKAPNSGYFAALKNDWIEECCAHMLHGKIKWPLETCKADALKYETRHDWKNTPKSGYQPAQKNGWLEECCRHMDIHKQITSKGTYSLSVLPRFNLAIGMYEGACYSTALRDDGGPDFASWKKFDDFENTELCEYIRKNCEVTDEEQFYYLSKALPNAL